MSAKPSPKRQQDAARAAAEELFRRGDLRHLLRPAQIGIFESVLKLMASQDKETRKWVLHCSRRFGKSYVMCALAVSVAITVPGAQIRYASVSQKAVRNIILPIFKDLLKSCPDAAKPEWKSLDGKYVFPNGSEIHVAGVNNGHADDLRGTSAHLAIIDEAGFVDRLKYLVDSVLMPQLLTTDGILLMASSSPLTPAHEFVSYIQESKYKGSYSKFTIYEAGYSEELVEEFKREAGGESSTAWKREYLCELVVDKELSIVPEYTQEKCSVQLPIQESTVDADPEDKRDSAQAPLDRSLYRPGYFSYLHKYISMDIGVKDQTVLLYGYYDFPNAQLVVEHEDIIQGADTTTRTIASSVAAAEKTLGYDDTRKIADNNNLVLLNDLGQEYDQYFQATNKDSLHAMVNKVRLWVDAGRIKVLDRCPTLLGCLEFGVWSNPHKKEFGRSSIYGHYDALASLIYMVRNVNESINPIPREYGMSREEIMSTVWADPDSESESPNVRALRGAFE